MATPEATQIAEPVTVVVIVAERDPYAMFDAVEVTSTGARLRGPLLLEVGERLTLRVARGEQSVEVAARVTSVERADHADPITGVSFVDPLDRLAPLLATTS